MIFSQNNFTCDNNFVYLNKIFYNQQEQASPILTPFVSTASEMTQQLTIDSKACTAVAAGNGCNTARNGSNGRGCD